MMQNSKDKVVEIFSGTLWESEMVINLLKDANINSFIKNNVLNTYGYDPIFSSGVKVMILNSDFDTAIEIVNKYCKNMNKK